MTDGTTAGFPAAYDADAIRQSLTLRLKSMPWTRIVVDALLALSLLLASSSLLIVR